MLQTDGKPQRDRELKHLYGITVSEYEMILKEQNGVCAVCQKPCVTGKRLAVDHEHATQRVRGLLCLNCNQGLGKFKDDPDLLRRAAEYLTVLV